MRARLTIAVMLFTAYVLAQSPSPCPSDRPIDDIIAEIHKQQSKKYSRNKNPLPDQVCIFGWCPVQRTPKAPKEPKSVPPAEPPSRGPELATRTDVERCNEAMDRAVDAAHNVEVGDYYFDQKSYKAAQLRYHDALEAKPGDAAIEVRLGRAFEKLDDAPHAIEHYTAADKLGTPDKWVAEARSALARLPH